jgi:hypothetical protein
MKKTIIITVLLIAVLAGGFYTLNSYIYKEKQADVSEFTPQRMTLTGKQVCLPHKDTSGPQTLECAFGMQADNGFYYALDFGLMSQTPPEVLNGERFRASGVFTPIEMLSSDHMRKYDIVGVFTVTDSFEKI